MEPDFSGREWYMGPLAAVGDTWGIPGRTFLLTYLLLTAVVLVWSVLHRRRVTAGTPPLDPGQLGAQQVGYLNGGDRLALYATLGGLRGAGAITVTPDGVLNQAGPLPDWSTPLDRAVYDAARRRVAGRALGADRAVADGLAQLRANLADKGLLMGPDGRHSARLGGMLLLGVLGLGAVRLVAGLANGRPIGFLLLTMIGVLVLALVNLRTPTLTRAGRATVTGLRGRYHHLSPAQSPAYATYGAPAAAMGVALFGGASLWAMDPVFAQQAGVQRAMASGSPGTTGSSCSSTTSCSSSCSSGSSCGSSCGGGGCGGGCGG